MIENIIDISDFVEVQTEQKVIADLVNRFIKRRKEYGLTQQKLSEQSGVSYGSIRRFETKGEISFTSLIKISSTLGLLDEFNSLFKKPIIKSLI